MPIAAKDIEQMSYLRLLVLGGPKVGKTRTVLETCHKPAYVINSDDKLALRSAAQVTQDFDWDLALGDDAKKMDTCIRAARDGIEAGRYKTIVWDTLTKYAARFEELCERSTMNAKGESDGRRYWPMYKKHLHNVIDRLFALKAHVIVNAHYIDVAGALIDNQLDKTGAGICPLLGGQARATIPAEFQDVIFLEKRAGARRFIASADGVFGPGCRSLPGVTDTDANIQTLWDTMQGKKTKEQKKNGT